MPCQNLLQATQAAGRSNETEEIGEAVFEQSINNPNTNKPVRARD